MIIKNLTTGQEVNVSNTSVCRDGFITAKIHGKEPSPRYYKNYPMLVKLGYHTDGRVMIGLEDGWTVVNGRQPAPEATPASTEKPQPATPEDAGADSTPATPASDATPATEDEAGADADATSAATEDEADSAPATEDAGADSTPAPATPTPFGGNSDPYSAWLEAMKKDITTSVMDKVEPLVEQATSAAAEATSASKAPAQRHEYAWPDQPTTEVEGVVCKQFNKMLLYLKRGYAVYMWGAAGCGKSHTAEQLAAALGLPLYCQAQVLFAHDVKGYGDAGGRYVETPFYKAFTEGAAFFIDEMDGSAAEALIVLNQAIANGRYNFPVVGEVKAHPNFRVIAAGNTAMTGADTQYTGRTVQDASSRNRFAFIHMDYDRNVELPVIAAGDAGVVDFVEDMRQSIETAGLELVISYRQTAALADVVLRENVSKPELLQDFCFGGVEVDELRIIYGGLIDKDSEWAKALQSLIA